MDLIFLANLKSSSNSIIRISYKILQFFISSINLKLSSGFLFKPIISFSLYKYIDFKMIIPIENTSDYR